MLAISMAKNPNKWGKVKDVSGEIRTESAIWLCQTLAEEGRGKKNRDRS
mgnify:CR=1 FL=1